MTILFSKGYLHILLLHIYGLSAQYIIPSLGMYMYIREQAFVDCNISEVKGRFWGKIIIFLQMERAVDLDVLVDIFL